MVKKATADSNSFFYGGNIEVNSDFFFDPADCAVNVFARDPQIGWVDTLTAATDGYLHFTVSQV